ncbi:MAG TPA: ATP-binding protein [Steroidobacteraceae bacterium]|nr:ATP-binding protein [Steroidobacteraceae bacterium]
MRFSLEGKLAALLLALLAVVAAAIAVVTRFVGDVRLAALLVVAAGVLPMLWLARAAIRPLRRLLRAMCGAVASYRDGDFSLSLVVDRDDELGQLLVAHNDLGHALREQRTHLVQRELLLDTVTQNSPVALVLVDARRHIVYANHAARHLLNKGRTLLGYDFADLLALAPEPLRTAVDGAGDALFSTDMDGAEETFHLSQRSFMLQGRSHRLYLLKRLTRELSRQEVTTWKKLIRVLSHELNNSLGPIASLAHSGAEVTRRGETDNLAVVFAAIGERAAHLHQFISGYAAFARLPAPRLEPVEWSTLLAELGRQQPCRVAAPLPAEPGWFDRSQLEQALINLLKNAHEAGGPSADVEIAVNLSGDEQRIDVLDRGPGMSETVLAHALLPFYSTKRSGTGLGLALAREIAEAHGGRIRVANRESGGLCVSLLLPLPRVR